MTLLSARAGSGVARAAAARRLKVLGLMTLGPVAVGDIGGVTSTTCCDGVVAAITCCFAGGVGGAAAWSPLGGACMVAVGCAAEVWLLAAVALAAATSLAAVDTLSKRGSTPAAHQRFSYRVRKT